MSRRGAVGLLLRQARADWPVLVRRGHARPGQRVPGRCCSAGLQRRHRRGAARRAGRRAGGRQRGDGALHQRPALDAAALRRLDAHRADARAVAGRAGRHRVRCDLTAVRDVPTRLRRAVPSPSLRLADAALPVRSARPGEVGRRGGAQPRRPARRWHTGPARHRPRSRRGRDAGHAGGRPDAARVRRRPDRGRHGPGRPGQRSVPATRPHRDRLGARAPGAVARRRGHVHRRRARRVRSRPDRRGPGRGAAAGRPGAGLRLALPGASRRPRRRQRGRGARGHRADDRSGREPGPRSPDRPGQPAVGDRQQRRHRPAGDLHRPGGDRRGGVVAGAGGAVRRRAAGAGAGGPGERAAARRGARPGPGPGCLLQPGGGCAGPRDGARGGTGRAGRLRRRGLARTRAAGDAVGRPRRGAGGGVRVLRVARGMARPPFRAGRAPQHHQRDVALETPPGRRGDGRPARGRRARPAPPPRSGVVGGRSRSVPVQRAGAAGPGRRDARPARLPLAAPPAVPPRRPANRSGRVRLVRARGAAAARVDAAHGRPAAGPRVRRLRVRGPDHGEPGSGRRGVGPGRCRLPAGGIGAAARRAGRAGGHRRCRPDRTRVRARRRRADRLAGPVLTAAVRGRRPRPLPRRDRAGSGRGRPARRAGGARAAARGGRRRTARGRQPRRGRHRRGRRGDRLPRLRVRRHHGQRCRCRRRVPDRRGRGLRRRRPGGLPDPRRRGQASERGVRRGADVRPPTRSRGPSTRGTAGSLSRTAGSSSRPPRTSPWWRARSRPSGSAWSPLPATACWPRCWRWC